MTFETQATKQAAQDQLDLVAKEFDDWRKQKKYKKEKIPLKLLREAQKLTEHLEEKTVRRRLGITNGQLNRSDCEKNAIENGSSDFVKLSALDANTGCESLRVDIYTPDGIKISLSGLSQQDPLALISKLIQG